MRLTNFQKQYRRVVTVRGVTLEAYPQREFPDEIPTQLRRLAGTPPENADDLLDIIREIAKAFDNVLGFASIDHVYAVARRDAGAELVWLTKQGRATMGVDRMGKVKSVKARL